MSAVSSRPDWQAALGRYLVASIILHLAWEILQLPLYTIWSEPIAKQAFAVLHCTLGDLMIAGLCLLAALAFFGRPQWPRAANTAVWISVLVLSAVYTVYSEWLNVSVRGSWAYSVLMPTIPPLGTGLSPLLQWLVVPTAALAYASGRAPWLPQTA